MPERPPGGGGSGDNWMLWLNGGYLGNTTGWKYVFPTSPISSYVWFNTYKNGCGEADDCAYDIPSIESSASAVSGGSLLKPQAEPCMMGRKGQFNTSQQSTPGLIKWDGEGGSHRPSGARGRGDEKNARYRLRSTRREGEELRAGMWRKERAYSLKQGRGCLMRWGVGIPHALGPAAESGDPTRVLSNVLKSERTDPLSTGIRLARGGRVRA